MLVEASHGSSCTILTPCHGGMPLVDYEAETVLRSHFVRPSICYVHDIALALHSDFWMAISICRET